MDLNLSEHLPEDFDSRSRVWVYQSSRLFLISEALEIGEMLQSFIQSWNSHGTPVKGYANLFFGQFIIIMADETATGVSGCSTDSSVRVIKEIGKRFNVDMFNRQLLSFYIKNKVEQIPLAQLAYAIENNFLSSDRLYFDNTILTKDELLNKWIAPARDSWLKNRFRKV